jgi:hypothetical protein
LSYPEIDHPLPVTPSERASSLVRGDRQADYGHPLENHQRIAAFWTVRLRDKLAPRQVIEPHEVAAMMRLVKEARLMQTIGHEDSLVDLSGYVDVEWEIHRELERVCDSLRPLPTCDTPSVSSLGPADREREQG